MSGNSFGPLLDYYGTKITLKFSRNILKQDKITYTHRKIVHIYNVYEISKNHNISSYSSTRKVFVWCS